MPQRCKSSQHTKAKPTPCASTKGRRTGTGMEDGSKKSEKTVRLLQQSDGAPRFGKHGLQLCSV